jgi:c-di-GMP-binding flagellar brake protein YcgR
MQQYNKYFRPEQKVQLRLVNPLLASTETLTLCFANQGPGYFELAFPYKSRNGEEFPLPPGVDMELTTESMGVGVKMTVEFLAYVRGTDMIRVKGIGELKAFQRRTQPRIDIQCGVRFTRGQGALRSLREHWLKNIEIINQINPEDLPPFTQSHINLSSTGFRLAIKPPVECADLFLVLVQLSPGTKPLCLLCETVWTGTDRDEEGRIPCGMHFIGMTDADRKTVEAQVKRAITA